MKKYLGIKSDLDKYIKMNPNLSKNAVANHFIALGYAKRSIYRWIRQIEETGTIETKKYTGRPVSIATKGNMKKITKYFNHRSSRSQNFMARKLGCTQQYVSYLLKRYTRIRCRKKLKRPYRTPSQVDSAKTKCGTLYRLYRNIDFILDDESYFTLSSTSVPGNDSFYSDNLDITPQDVMYKNVEKFPKKILVWVAISSKGMSSPYFVPSGNAIKQQLYLQIIKEKLEPFINKYYKGGGYVFWPDLASSHYANSVLKYLKSKKIPFVAKRHNPANVPEARPIENFWANLKSEVYKGGWQAKNLEELKERIQYCLRNMDKTFVQTHAEGVKKRLDQIRRHGVNFRKTNCKKKI